MRSVNSIELVIPSFNRLATLRNTLKHIRLLYPGVNICLGLQGEMPDDDFKAEIERDPHLRVMVYPVPSTTTTLNQCIFSSEADVILILDDDVTPCCNWIESHLSAFAENPALPYTCGREVRSTKARSSFSEWFRIIIESLFGMFLGKDKKLNGRIVGWINTMGVMFGNFDQAGSCTINSPRGCNMALRKSSFLKIGGFNGAFRGNAWGFEADFGVRMARTVGYGQYLGNAIVIHHETPTGGSRNALKNRWVNDFFYNHKILIHTLGPFAWIGALPRLIKRIYFS